MTGNTEPSDRLASPYNFTNWVGVDDAGVHRIRDPETHEFINPAQLPELVLADPALREGIDYLRQQGSSVRCKVVVGPHRKPEELDLGQAPGTFQGWVNNAQACLYEAGGWSQSWHDEMADAIRNNRQLPQHHPYLAAVIGSAIRAGVPSTSFDVRFPLDFLPSYPTEGQPYYAEAVAHGLGVEIASPLYRSKENYRDLFTVWNYLREGVMVGRIGLALKDLWGVLPTGEAKEAVITVGTGHRDLIRKLNLCGVQVDPIIQIPDHYADPHSQSAMLPRALETGVIDTMPLV